MHATRLTVQIRPVQMRRYTPFRLAVVLMFFMSAGMYVFARGQAGPSLFTKPAAAPPATAPPAAVAPANTEDTAQRAPSQQPPRRAEVSFAQGQLAVKADNSSLNQILREIGRQTGIKITGGVSDERVFGKYGPSPTSEVLASLLEGTSSNLLLLHSDAASPGELILTPRQGGVTPPNPNAPGFDDEGSGDDSPQPQVQEPTQQAPPVPLTGYHGSAANGGLPPSQAPAATEAPDPNAVKTPQQIYEQLQRLRQQQTTAPQ